MITINQVKNQKQQVLFYLYNNQKPFSYLNILNDSRFVKFQSRLSDLEHEHGALTEKTREGFVNRFGNKGSYALYKTIDREKVLEIFNKL